MALDRKCESAGCVKTYIDHYAGKRQAQKSGWYFQRNGAAWCPKCLPAWVIEWRLRKSAWRYANK